MASVRELELPQGWTAPSRLRTFGLAALTAGFGLGLLAIGGPGMTDPVGVHRVLALGVVLMGVALVGGSVMLGRRGPRRSVVSGGVDLTKTDGGVPVLRIRQPRALRLASTLLLLCFGGGSLLFGAAALAMGGPVGVPIAACGAVLVGMRFAMIAWGVPEIRIGERVVQVRSGGRLLTTTWDDVRYFDGYETRHQRLLVISSLRVERQAARLYWATPAQRRRDAERIEIGTEQFAVPPVLLFHLLRFYHEHPLARTELGTAAALRRLREARFTAP